ncbi:DUF6708 domain-containing protein [Chromohalobacter israelensis]|uniref:DUF6708 domain-containing protein n=1 Tax=Chromohalobacter israelensis (strain ATCC BAA-138 / DSM 3043 / CIP 106854 / NCIMB 13768 / 1H11) TaxID=290398 RepID=Q1QVA7_CHRI1|nr:DUF6708 domain-containing protein [Chromohalobacter salexigens]ABE59601.1 hypothetical protein Csal_2251 [Chromohalobacter salexigens DSM 3043]
MIHEYNIITDCLLRKASLVDRAKEFDRSEDGTLDHFQRAGVFPGFAESVYAKTSNYLEVSNAKEYGWRGQFTAGMGFPCIAILLFSFYVSYSSVVDIYQKGFNYVWFFSIPFTVALAAGLVYVAHFVFGLSHDWFHYRHGAIRFNFKERKVHAFFSPKLGGPRTYDWDDIVAYIDAFHGKGGHGNPVHYTLKLYACDPLHKKYYDMLEPGSEIIKYEDCLAWWEYVRRFMEEGPDSVPEPDWYLSDRLSLKESFLRWFPLREMKRDKARGLSVEKSKILMVLMSPLLILFSLGHFVSMLTSKRVKWPEDIRKACGEV